MKNIPFKTPPEMHAQPNTTFGGNLINQKYSPVQGIDLNKDSDYSILMRNRESVIGSPTRIVFKHIIGDINEIPRGTAPFVVISNNRSAWMIKKFHEFREYLKINPEYALNANLLSDIDKPIEKRTPGLLYDPLRTKRPLIILVHLNELEEYKNKLNKLLDYHKQTISNVDFTLIGWNVEVGQENITGFGASRFAGIKLLKHLQFHKGWLVDDDVVHLNNIPPTINDLEQLIMPPTNVEMPLKNVAAIGFKGTTEKVSLLALESKVKHSIPSPLPHSGKEGFAQQLVLWNIDELNSRNTNFCPYYITSNEDSSFCKILNTSKPNSVMTFSYYSIIKLDPSLNLDREIPIANNHQTLAMVYEKEENYLINKNTTLQQFLQNNPKYTNNHRTSSQIIEQISAYSIDFCKKNIRNHITIFQDSAEVVFDSGNYLHHSVMSGDSGAPILLNNFETNAAVHAAQRSRSINSFNTNHNSPSGRNDIPPLTAQKDSRLLRD